MLCPGVDGNTLATDLALHIVLTFSSGTRPNAGGVNRGSNTANNTKTRFIRTPHAMRLEQENLLVVSRFPHFEKRSPVVICNGYLLRIYAPQQISCYSI